MKPPIDLFIDDDDHNTYVPADEPVYIDGIIWQPGPIKTVHDTNGRPQYIHCWLSPLGKISAGHRPITFAEFRAKVAAIPKQRERRNARRRERYDRLPHRAAEREHAYTIERAVQRELAKRYLRDPDNFVQPRIALTRKGREIAYLLDIIRSLRLYANQQAFGPLEDVRQDLRETTKQMFEQHDPDAIAEARERLSTYFNRQPI